MKPIKNPSSNSKSKPTAPPADLLVCFPARSRLTLLPKPNSSPAIAPAEPNRRSRHHKKPAQASPLLWAKEMSSEPTSPKVTCAGQIKIRPNRSKNWQSVMQEIERIHNNNNKKKKIPSWGNRNKNQNQNQNPLGLKGEIVNFLSCLRGFRLDFRCFRGFPQSELTTESESESESEAEPVECSRKTMFSEWFMVLEEEERKPRNDVVCSVDVQGCSVPPANALLLMRCRSAPSIGLIERKPKKEEKEKERLGVMDYYNYDSDFEKLSSDIAKETWLVTGNTKDDHPFMIRTRSSKT